MENVYANPAFISQELEAQPLVKDVLLVVLIVLWAVENFNVLIVPQELQVMMMDLAHAPLELL